MFSHLQVRSAYTFHSGPRRIEDLVHRARELGFTSMALTDQDNLYGVHDFIEAAGAAGLRPIIGTELTTQKGSVVILVKDREGFGNLCELISARKAADAGRNRLATRPASGRGDVTSVGSRIGTRGGRDSPEGENRDRPGEALPDLTEDLVRLSGGLVFATYSPLLLSALAGRGTELYAAISPRRIGAVVVARNLGLSPIALGDAAFITREDWQTHRLLRAIGTNTTLGRLDPSLLDDPASILFGPDEAAVLFSSWPEALSATEHVADECRFSSIFDGYFFPSYAGNGAGSKALLRRLTFEGAEKRWGELCDAVIDRLEYELDIITRKNFADYFLVVAEIAGLTKRICGRGSGAASAVAYSLGITNVDPLRHHLYFERFLNDSRPDPPDIDIDFAWDERDDIIRSAIERFGSSMDSQGDRAARVANHLSFKPRSALREAAKAWGMADGEIAVCAKAVFELGQRDIWETKPVWREIFAAAASIEGLPFGLSMHCGGLVITPGPIRRFAPVETSAEGYPLIQWEKDGAEAAGLVKIDLLGNRSLAVIRDALDNLEVEGIRIAEGADFERLVLADPDTERMLASGDTMGVFYIESPAMRQLQKKAGVGDYEHIVIHSSIIRPAANKYITQFVKRCYRHEQWTPLHPRLAGIFSETCGILCYQEDVSKAAIALAGFDECSADALRKILAKKNKAAKLAEFRERFFSGCARNGVGESIASEVWSMMESFSGYSFCKPHSASYAVVSFQSAWLRCHHPAEFMAAVLSNGGGFYTASAYVSEARRMGIPIMGPDINESEWKYRAIPAKGISKGGNDIGLGSARNGRDRGPTMTDRNVLMIGLMAVSGLGRRTGDEIVEERAKNGRFQDLASFVARMSAARRPSHLAMAGPTGIPTMKDGPRQEREGQTRDDGISGTALGEGQILSLVEAGFFDSVAGGASRPMQARILLCALRREKKSGKSGLFVTQEPIGIARKETDSPVKTRFSGQDNDYMPGKEQNEDVTYDTSEQHAAGGQTRDGVKERRSEAAEKAKLRILEAEYRSMGFLRDQHPLALWQERVNAINRVVVKDLHDHLGSEAIIVCIPITRKEVLTGGGEDMAFVSLEDETAIIEAVLFPDVYRRYASLLGLTLPLIVTGRVEDDLGAISFEIERIRPLVNRVSTHCSPLPDEVGAVLAQDGFGILPHRIIRP